MANQYPFIRAWGQILGSNVWYIDDEIARAKKAGAPARAIYPKHANDGSGQKTGEWATVDDIANSDTKARVEKIVASHPEWGN